MSCLTTLQVHMFLIGVAARVWVTQDQPGRGHPTRYCVHPWPWPQREGTPYWTPDEWAGQGCAGSQVSHFMLEINWGINGLRDIFCIRCDDRAKSSGWWPLGSPLSAVVWQLAPRAWFPLLCLLAKTVGVLSPGVGRSEECAQEFAPQSHIHSGLNQRDLMYSDVFLAHSDQHTDGRWWFGSSCQGCWSGLSVGHIHCFLVSRLISTSVSEGSWLLCMRWRGEVEGVLLRWRGEVEGVLLLPLPVCLQSRFQQCQHVLAPTGAVLCCCLTEYTGFCVAAGCEGQWGHLSENEEQTGSQGAGQYSASCSLLQSGVLWQLSGCVLLFCSWSSGHQLGLRGRRLFHLGDGCRHRCLHS